MLGGSINVTSTDSYNDEKAQDAVAASFTNGIHTGISYSYDDTTGRINSTVNFSGYLSIASLKTIVSQSTSFEDYQTRIAAL